MTVKEYQNAQRGDKLHYVRVMPTLGYYEIHDLILVSKYDDHCSATETKTKQSFIFIGEHIYEDLYYNRNEALEHLKELKNKYKNVKVITERED